MPETTQQRDQPLVSVVITTYNRPSHLKKAVQSVSEQTYDAIELLVVDDHSDTPAQQILDELDLDRFHTAQCIRHEENRGANAARNTGIRASSGTFIAFLDDDDQWLPRKIQRQVTAFEDGVGVVYTGTKFVSESDTGVKIPPEITGDMTKALLCRNVVGTLSKVMVRRTVATDVPFDERFLSWADLEWFITLSTETTFKRLPEPLVVYHFTAHDRLSDDIEKKRRSYELYLEKFDPLAAEYGRMFRRKFRGWAAYRLGKTVLQNGHYSEARTLLSRAVRNYPLEPKFSIYLSAALGGRPTHEAARAINRLVPG